MSIHIKSVVVMVALLSVTRLAIAGNFSGQWILRSSGQVLTLQDDGDYITGTSYTSGWDHTLDGRHLDSERVTLNIGRTTIANGCHTTLFSKLTSLGPNTARWQIFGSDGRCSDVPANYSLTAILERL